MIRSSLTRGVSMHIINLWGYAKFRAVAHEFLWPLDNIMTLYSSFHGASDFGKIGILVL